MGKITFGKFEFEGKGIRTATLNTEFYALRDIAAAIGVTPQGLRKRLGDTPTASVRWRSSTQPMVFVSREHLTPCLRATGWSRALQLAAEIELRAIGIAESQKVEDEKPATPELLPPHHTAELIPLTEDGSGATAVSGRALHEFLGVKERYNDWLPRMLTYGFSAGQDFTEISVQSPRARGGMMKDHVLTLDMGKELSMIQRTDRGKAARQYFIEVEKQAKATPQFEVPQTYAAALRAAADATDRADLAERKVTELEPRAKGYDRFMDDDGHLMTWDRVARLLGLGKVGMLASLRAEGILMRGRKGETWNIPYQAYQHHFDMKVWEGKARNGDPITSTKVRVKPSGLDFIAKRLGVEEVAA